MELGEKIRKLRVEKEMTLKELSKRSGVSMSLLSMVERNLSIPTVRTLEKVVKALGTMISSLYLEMEAVENSNTDEKGVTVVRRKERKKLILGPERGKARYELLTPDYQRRLQFVYIHFPVGNGKQRFITHEGEECGLILEGRLKAYIGDQEIILEEGDTIYLASTIPHRFENIGDIEVRAFWINTPASF